MRTYWRQRHFNSTHKEPEHRWIIEEPALGHNGICYFVSDISSCNLYLFLTLSQAFAEVSYYDDKPVLHMLGLALYVCDRQNKG